MKYSTSDLLKEYRKLSTSMLSDILSTEGLEGRVTYGFRQVLPGVTLVGVAATVKISSGLYGDYDKSEVDFTKMYGEITADSVLVVDNTGLPLANVGDMSSLYLKQLGAAGAVIDGGARDIDVIRELGFPVFARHFVPFSGAGKMHLVSVGRRVQCGGAHVSPGDIVVADGSGIVFIPAERAADILDTAIAMEEREKKVRDAILAGKSFTEAAHGVET